MVLRCENEYCVFNDEEVKDALGELARKGPHHDYGKPVATAKDVFEASYGCNSACFPRRVAIGKLGQKVLEILTLAARVREDFERKGSSMTLEDSLEIVLDRKRRGIVSRNQGVVAEDLEAYPCIIVDLNADPLSGMGCVIRQST